MESKLSRALAPKRPDAPTLTSRQLVKAWWQALRPPFFIVDLIPVGLGGALAARLFLFKLRRPVFHSYIPAGFLPSLSSGPSL